MKILLGLFVLLVLGLGAWYILISSKSQTPQSTSTAPGQVSEQTIDSQATVDYSASFAIFTNGTFRIFTDAMYHNLSSDVYIESTNPNTVNVKKERITWDDFFKTLPFKLTKECLTTGTGQTFCTGNGGTLRFYLNGIESQNALDQIINSDDKLLVTFGNETEEQIQKQIEQIP